MYRDTNRQNVLAVKVKIQEYLESKFVDLWMDTVAGLKMGRHLRMGRDYANCYKHYDEINTNCVSLHIDLLLGD